MKHLLDEMSREEDEQPANPSTSMHETSGRPNLNYTNPMHDTFFGIEDDREGNFELDDRFMFKLMKQLGKNQNPDSAVSGLTMGLASQMCSQIGQRNEQVVERLNQTYVQLHNISMQQRSVIIDKSKDETNMSSASHPILGTFITGTGENLLPAELYASNSNGHSNSNIKYTRQGTELGSSQAGFLDTEIDMSAENIRMGGHDA